MKALEGQNKRNEAKNVARQFKKAWRYADTRLTINDL